MSKIAKLVCVSLMTRVIVDSNLSEDELLEEAMKQARPQFIDKLTNDGLGDHLESIEDDEEMPFGEDPNDLQPRIHIGNDDFCTKCGSNITGEQHTCK